MKIWRSEVWHRGAWVILLRTSIVCTEIAALLLLASKAVLAQTQPAAQQDHGSCTALLAGAGAIITTLTAAIGMLWRRLNYLEDKGMANLETALGIVMKISRTVESRKGQKVGSEETASQG